jgi:hypothetical protein
MKALSKEVLEDNVEVAGKLGEQCSWKWTAKKDRSDDWRIGNDSRGYALKVDESFVTTPVLITSA